MGNFVPYSLSPKKPPLRFPLWALLVLASLPAMAQTIRINEFLAENVTNYPDNADFDDYSD